MITADLNFHFFMSTTRSIIITSFNVDMLIWANWAIMPNTTQLSSTYPWWSTNIRFQLSNPALEFLVEYSRRVLLPTILCNICPHVQISLVILIALRHDFLTVRKIEIHIHMLKINLHYQHHYIYVCLNLIVSFCLDDFGYCTSLVYFSR